MKEEVKEVKPAEPALLKICAYLGELENTVPLYHAGQEHIIVEAKFKVTPPAFEPVVKKLWKPLDWLSLVQSGKLQFDPSLKTKEFFNRYAQYYKGQVNDKGKEHGLGRFIELDGSSVYEG